MNLIEKAVKWVKDRVLLANTLYFPGCLTHFVLSDKEDSYKKILNELGIEYIFIPEFNCCGSPVLHAGYKKDFNDLKKKNFELFRKYGVGKIITNCPGCYMILSKEYGLKVEHISQVLAKNLDKVNKKFDGDVTYHDPCHLGRKSSNIYNEPRIVLAKLGLNIEEFPKNRERSLCCGAGGGLRNNYRELADKIAKERLRLVKTKRLVTTCPMCYKHFLENSKDIEVKEFSEFLI